MWYTTSFSTTSTFLRSYKSKKNVLPEIKEKQIEKSQPNVKRKN